MYEVVFRCSQCATHLSASAEDAGFQFDCPSCGAALAVPAGDLLFSCPNCQTSIIASQDSAGETFGCPRCQTQILVPTCGREIPISNHHITTTGERAAPDPPEPVSTADDAGAASLSGDKSADERQFMMTWGDYLAQAGLTKDKKSDTKEKK